MATKKNSKKSSKKRTAGMGEPSSEFKAYVRAQQKKFPATKTVSKIHRAPDRTDPYKVTVETSYDAEPMSGCEEIGFDVMLGHQFLLRSSPLNERQRVEFESLPDDIITLAQQFFDAAEAILKAYEGAVKQQHTLDMRFAKENDDLFDGKADMKRKVDGYRSRALLRIAKAYSSRKGGR